MAARRASSLASSVSSGTSQATSTDITSSADGERLVREQAEFRGTARESKERVKLLTQLADGLVDKGHAHAAHIKQWVAAVDSK